MRAALRARAHNSSLSLYCTFTFTFTFICHLLYCTCLELSRKATWEASVGGPPPRLGRSCARALSSDSRERHVSW